MQVGDSAEVPHDQAHRYQQHIKVDDYETFETREQLEQ